MTDEKVRIRTIALPPEHGTWGMVLEPILLGMLVAPSAAGACLALAAFAAFLTRRPIKVRLTQHRRKGARRTRVADLFILLYGGTSVAGFATTSILAGVTPVLPLLLASPLVVVFAFYDARNQSRRWQAELAGAVAFVTVATGIALAGGWAFGSAFALSAVLVARSVPSVLYVRARIRIERTRQQKAPMVVAMHVAGLAVVVALVWAELVPGVVVVAFLALLIRATVGLSRYRRPVPMKRIGWMEIALGALMVVTLVIGYRLGLT